MNSTDELKVATLTYQRESAREGRAQIALKKAIQAAAADGVPKTKIAELTEMSRQYVYDVLDGGERRRRAVKAKR